VGSLGGPGSFTIGVVGKKSRAPGGSFLFRVFSVPSRCFSGGAFPSSLRKSCLRRGKILCEWGGVGGVWVGGVSVVVRNFCSLRLFFRYGLGRFVFIGSA